MDKKTLVQYLDKYLKVGEFVDSSLNGLQVDNSKKEVKKIGYSVDASSYIFDRAKKEKVDMIVCHHGIFWGKEKALLGVHYHRIKKLLENDIALYASHIPLDAHPEVGNNIGLLKGFLKALGFKHQTRVEPFGEYKGKLVGYAAHFPKAVDISLLTTFAKQEKLEYKLHNFGSKKSIKSIAIVSGGAGSLVTEASEKGYDVFLTGEASHDELVLAKELGQSIFLGGHYETEYIGPELLCEHIKKKFGVQIVFLDEKY